MPYTKSTLDKMNTSKVITNSKHTKRKQESSVKRKSEKENSQEKRYTIEAYKQKKMWEKRLNENYFKLFRRTRSMSISRKERFRSSNTAMIMRAHAPCHQFILEDQTLIVFMEKQDNSEGQYADSSTLFQIVC